jgi:hypothetical protein
MKMLTPVEKDNCEALALSTRYCTVEQLDKIAKKLEKVELCLNSRQYNVS